MKKLRSAILEAVPSAQVEGGFHLLNAAYIYLSCLYNQERLEGEPHSR